MRDALLAIEQVVGVDREDGVRRHECAREVEVAARLGIPPAVRDADVAEAVTSTVVASLRVGKQRGLKTT